MTDSVAIKRDGKRLFYIMLIVTAILTILITFSILWNIQLVNDQAFELAKKEALTIYRKDVAFRLWATDHGGVYVTVTQKTPPNVYLKDIPEREIKTPSGKELTLMNPAYIIRQVMHDYAKQYNIQGHITSLNLLNPNNAPDEWEREALKSFDDGIEEVSDIISSPTGDHFRYMRALHIKKGCLKCHAIQGYKIGDVRGGIGVSIPMTQYYNIRNKAVHPLWITYGAIWLIGLASIWLVYSRSRKQLVVRLQAEEMLRQSEEKYHDLYNNAPDMYISVDAKTALIVHCNQTLAQMTGFTKEELINRSIFDMYTPESADYAKKKVFPQFLKFGKVEGEELKLLRKDGCTIDVSLNASAVRDSEGRIVYSRSSWRDITDRKKAETQIQASLKEKETLLQEIHHRVKNNMQVINSLLKLQANNIEDEKVKNILKDSQSRVYAMSAVHETLHGSENLSKIELKSYLQKVTTSIFQTYTIDNKKIKLISDFEESSISLNQAYPLGLVVNELMSNSMKYAFPDNRTGEISVKLKKHEKELGLVIQDDGIGMPKAFDWQNSNTLGLKLVRNLVENQLNGAIELGNTNGTIFTITFNLESY